VGRNPQRLHRGRQMSGDNNSNSSETAADHSERRDRSGSVRSLGYGLFDRDYANTLATTAPDDDGPLWMVNLMSYREVAAYEDGRASGITGREADNLYSPKDVLTEVGAEIVFVADVDTQLLGDSPRWDRVGVVKYATRRSFIEMQSRRDFKDKVVHKHAGMESTIVCGCVPIPTPQLPAGMSEVDWADVAHPPTADDGAVVVLHFLRFATDPADAGSSDITPAEMEAYQNAAGAAAVPHGVRIDAWFAVEGTIVGDGRTWDQVRFNEFPSKAAFMAVATDPARLEAQHAHREPAIADTYTMILRPKINHLAASLATP
ncbi:MAG: hypothetical protein ABIQ39_12105, partial [Ilumatobacteraceae bacterium]